MKGIRLGKNLKKNVSDNLQEFLCFIIRFSGILYLWNTYFVRNKITIINYHDPEPHIFEKHIKAFLKYYRMINIDELTDILYNQKKQRIAPRLLLITIDDGHKGNRKLLPIIKKYKIPVVIYCTAGITNTNRKFWFKLSTLTREQINTLKEIPDAQRRIWLKNIVSHEDKKQYKEPQALNKAEIKEFINYKCTIGSHTLFHPMLNRCSDQECKFEICSSKKHLEKITGHPVSHFAYPGGGKDSRCVNWVKHAGYKTARTIDPGWVTTFSDPFSLANFGIYDYARINKAMIQASGLWDWLKNFGKLQ